MVIIAHSVDKEAVTRLFLVQRLWIVGHGDRERWGGGSHIERTDLIRQNIIINNPRPAHVLWLNIYIIYAGNNEQHQAEMCLIVACCRSRETPLWRHQHAVQSLDYTDALISNTDNQLKKKLVASSFLYLNISMGL